MKSLKLFLAAGLLVAGISGAMATKTTEILYWFDGVNYQPIQTEISCPKQGTGCLLEVPGQGVQQLYRKVSPTQFVTLKIGA